MDKLSNRQNDALQKKKGLKKKPSQKKKKRGQKKGTNKNRPFFFEGHGQKKKSEVQFPLFENQKLDFLHST